MTKEVSSSHGRLTDKYEKRKGCKNVSVYFLSPPRPPHPSSHLTRMYTCNKNEMAHTGHTSNQDHGLCVCLCVWVQPQLSWVVALQVQTVQCVISCVENKCTGNIAVKRQKVKTAQFFIQLRTGVSLDQLKSELFRLTSKHLRQTGFSFGCNLNKVLLKKTTKKNGVFEMTFGPLRKTYRLHEAFT